MKRISRHIRGEKGIWFGNLRVSSLLFADDVVLLASSSQDLQCTLEQVAADCEVVEMRVRSSKSEFMVLNPKKVECSLQVGSPFLTRRSSSMLVSCS